MVRGHAETPPAAREAHLLVLCTSILLGMCILSPLYVAALTKQHAGVVDRVLSRRVPRQVD